MASSSSSSSGWKFDVFLSFNGEDTRETFTGHLYEALRKEGIFIFHNDRWLEHDISKEFLKGIEESRIAVVIFSQNYASSSWCLDELVKIMECRYERGQIIIPVFYDVDRSHVRRQSEKFAAAFDKHESKYKDDVEGMEKVEAWRTFLTEAASLSGYNIRVGTESYFIGRIVDKISSQLYKNSLFCLHGVVGINTHLEKVTSLLKMEINDVQIVGIWGMQGVGKTTIAKAIFNALSYQFEGSSFLMDIKENKCGMHYLQNILLSELLSRKANYAYDKYDGKHQIACRLPFMKVLVVLDGIDHEDHLDYLAGDLRWFGNGSRIIVTTRDKHLIGKNVAYEVTTLGDHEAIQLFNQHAFEGGVPLKCFEKLTWEIVRHAKGFPLTLKQWGSTLYKCNISQWRSVIDKIKNNSNSREKSQSLEDLDSFGCSNLEKFPEISMQETGIARFVKRRYSKEKHLVGIESRVKEVKSLLNVGLGGVYFVGIWGVGGSGKTTIARAIFDKISDQFEGSCFLENVRGTSKKHGPRGPEHLQMRLLSQILKQDSLNIESANEGVKMISGMLSFKKVLIVLDDVDNDDQLENLVGKRVWFGNGSRIITTTRNADLLQNHDELYCVPELDTDEALELFSWHAFLQETPDKAFENLSICVVIYANGLPLTLEVLGSFLYKKGMNEWRSVLDKLKDIGDGKVIKQLSLSLDGLSLNDKDIFLHIACFCRGKKKDYVITIMNRFGFESEIGVDILVTKSLLYISEGMIEMHDLIEQMGQQVARDTDQDQPQKRCILWHYKDIGTVYSENLIPSTHTFPIATKKELMQKWKYDVFLSFRGEDTRNNFVAHLYKRMEDVGIHAFKDDVKLERGKFISPELLKAIEESKFAVIIFSENYASSTWCLEELTKIMECVEKKGQEAIPIFYNVDPSDVRHQRNSFAKEMAKHTVNLKGNGPEKVQRWKDALHKAANIAGWDVRKTANGDEAECIELIVNKIFRSVEGMSSSFAKNLVGIESRVKAVKSLLNVELGGVYFVGIWGMGGVGKTTVARAIFDEFSYLFQGSCFLENIKDISKKYGPEGPEHLQKKLLSQILKQQSLNISSSIEGVKMIRKMLSCKKVLIVLDDVDNNEQLEYLVGKSDWFGDGSRIITTSRNSDLLLNHNQLYRVPELTIPEALELFSWRAFQKGTPDKEFGNLSSCVVNYANGLPLALEVWGRFLYRQGMDVWRSALDRLEDIGDGKILKQLSISLDGLSHEDKDIFLDIACFFRGKKKDDVITILNSFGFKAEIGINILIRRSVLYISEGMVEMHDLIEQMGQQEARDINQDQPWKHSRLWHRNDIETVFSENVWTESVKGITVPIGSDQYICKWSKAFRSMPCLRLLIVKGEEVRLYEPASSTIEYLPSSLKWLDWSYYSFESLPANFQPRNLVGLNMISSTLVEICKEPKAFDKLTTLNLSFSENLLRTPSFSETPNLKRIILKNCLSLVEVHPSIGNLKKLNFLNMENCKNLKFLLSSIHMESLESLNLSGCEKLEKFPEISGQMKLLSELLLGRTAVSELPSSIGLLTGISLLNLHLCKDLVRLPASITEMKKLKVLILKGCSKLANLPENLGDLKELEELYARNTMIWQLPDTVRELSRLKVLSLGRGRTMKCLSSGNLMLPIVLYGLSELKMLDLSGCNISWNEVYALGCLTSLLELNLSRNNLTSISGIARLFQLQYLNITHCQELTELPELPRNLKELYAEDFLGIHGVVALWTCPLLYLVSFTNYSFGQQSYTEKSIDNSVLDQILSCFLSGTEVNVVYDRKGISIVFPGCAVPRWFKHQSIEEKILFELPKDWFDYDFQGFAICCVTCMGAGVDSPGSGLSRKYDYTFIKAKLICNNNPEKIKVLEKECKVGTASRTFGWSVCFAYIPLYFLLQASGSDARNLNQYGLFEASINKRITRQWGVHLIYKTDRKFFRSRIDEALIGPYLDGTSVQESVKRKNFVSRSDRFQPPVSSPRVDAATRQTLALHRFTVKRTLS